MAEQDPPPRRLHAVDDHDRSGASRKRVRVGLVLSDHLVRSAVCMLLAPVPEVTVIAEVTTVAAALPMLSSARADVVVVGRRATDGVRSDSVRQLRRAGASVVVIAMSEDSGLACEAISAGAAGYVLLDTAEVDLVEAVLAAARGDCYISPRLAAGLSAQTRAEPRKLSKLHTAVLRLVAHDNTDAQVMHELAISAGTLEMCRSEIYRQLGIASRAELTRYALRHGLLGSG